MMGILRPVAISGGMLVTSTAINESYPAWSGATDYDVGDVVIRSLKMFEALQGNTGFDPITDSSDPPKWLDRGYINQWRMFDEQVGTLTSSPTSSLTVEVAPGVINSVGLVEMVGTSARCQYIDADGVTVLYDQTQRIDKSVILNMRDYFFEPFDYASVLVFNSIPAYLSGKVRITITGGNYVSLGAMLCGTMYQIGETQFGASAGINDYSRVETNPFGVTKILERKWAKTSSMRVMIDTRHITRVQRLLASIRARPSLYIGTEDTQTFDPFVVYGKYDRFNIEVPYPRKSYCSIELKGMI